MRILKKLKIQANFDQHRVWTLLLSVCIMTSQSNTGEGTVLFTWHRAIRPTPYRTLPSHALHPASWLSQITYSSLPCVRFPEGSHTGRHCQEPKVKRKKEDRQFYSHFFALSVARFTPRRLFLPDSLSKVPIHVAHLDPASFSKS